MAIGLLAARAAAKKKENTINDFFSSKYSDYSAQQSTIIIWKISPKNI